MAKQICCEISTKDELGKLPTHRQQWLPYVRRIADMIALKDWQFDILEELPPTGGILSIWPCVGRKIGTLRFGEGFLDGTPCKQRHGIVHELIHCHLAVYNHAVDKTTEDDPIIMMLAEYTVDALTDAFAHLLPLPSVK
jgi:hypothetical protein